MAIAISLSKELTPKLLQKVLSVGNPTIRVLDSRCLKDGPKESIYLYVTADESGDYTVSQVYLGRKSLTSNDFFVRSDRELETGLQSLWEAHQRLSKAHSSVSGARPMRAMIFPLSMMGMQFHPNLEQIIFNWGNTQDIIPLTYATYNPRIDAIELGLQDPGARNTSVRMRIMEQGIFSELKAYLEKHPEIGEYDVDKLSQLVDPDNLELKPDPVQPEMPV